MHLPDEQTLKAIVEFLSILPSACASDFPKPSGIVSTKTTFPTNDLVLTLFKNPKLP